jgi:hypothetical protein
MCVIITGGLVECWGQNKYGSVDPTNFTDHDAVLLPKVVTLLTEPATQLVMLGAAGVCALLSTHAVECWGMFGPVEYDGAGLPPTLIMFTRDVLHISAGDNQVCGTLDNGDVVRAPAHTRILTRR